MAPNTIEACCPHCGNWQRVERNEDGSPDLVTQPCHEDGCTARLCAKCPQYECEACGLAHCKEHLVEACGLSLCPLCVRGMCEDAAAEAEVELANQSDAFAAMALAAGCTLGQVAALERMVAS